MHIHILYHFVSLLFLFKLKLQFLNIFKIICLQYWHWLRYYSILFCEFNYHLLTRETVRKRNRSINSEVSMILLCVEWNGCINVSTALLQHWLAVNNVELSQESMIYMMKVSSISALCIHSRPYFRDTQLARLNSLTICHHLSWFVDSWSILGSWIKLF